MYEYHVEITHVYAGDTCTGTVDLGFGFFARKAKFRLLGIDTDELRGGTWETRASGLQARDWLKARVLGKNVRIHSVSKGKYGRYLVRIWLLDDNGAVTGSCLNDAMIEAGIARAYE